MDRVTPEKRSEIMSRIRSRDTGIEIALRKALFAAGIRGYRLYRRIERCRADLVFVGKRVAVFVDGCFWHGCPECYKAPKSNESYWSPKIEANRARDHLATGRLEAAGWTVLRFWEHSLKKGGIDRVVQAVGEAVRREM